jgi:tight adherence protein C
MALTERILTSHLEPREQSSRQFKTWLSGLRSNAAKRKFRAESMQFPNVVRALSLLLSNGLPVGVAISWISPKLSGFWRQKFSEIHQNLELGAALEDQLEQLAIAVPLPEVSEFSQKLIIAYQRGVPIAEQLQELANSLEAAMMRDLTKRSGVNETKMLIPTVFLILPVTVLFAIFPSLLALQATY